MTANPLAPAWLDVPLDANALAAQVWPPTATRTDAGELTVAGVSATALAAEFGTPLYVLDEQSVRDRAREAQDAFSRELEARGSTATVYYAGKAFLSAELARWVTEEGLNVDVCTGGELALALAAGVEPGRIGFHGNNKSLAEIDRAVSVGVGTIVIDSDIEIDRVAEAAVRHGRTQRVRLRVNSGVDAHTHEYLATALQDQKFGIPLADVPRAATRIRAHDSLDFLGLHSHIGSQILDTDAFAEAARRLLAVHAELCEVAPVPELNLGGGYGIAYTSSEQAPSLTEVAADLARIVEAECGRLGIPLPVLAVEPGRAIVGAAGITLYEVGTIKDVTVHDVTVYDDAATTDAGTAVRRYVSVDGGMSDNARTALYAADYTARLANRTSSAEPVLVRVAGKHCESGDIVVRDEYLPADVAPGDVLAVAATGAYCWSLASNYNFGGRPPVVAVRDGVARVIVRGETEAEVLARDAGIPGWGER
ncbi:MAG TPA: diaminopimelate decarboxylase [Terrimesophilobacter sp.]|nr:diaminopimelate decarboxylase [Terrimesophilobacter sp.]